jgi:hypothetical protein
MTLHAEGTMGKTFITSSKLLTLGFVAVCAAGSCGAATLKLHPPIPDDTEVLRVMQVAQVATRQQITLLGEIYQTLLASGIKDSELSDGSLFAAHVYCCEPNVERLTSFLVFVPTGVQIAVGDIVEVRMGRAPTTDDPGAVNTVVRVRQNGTDGGPCRWVKDKPDFASQILHCSWMTEEGWVERDGLYLAWLKYPGVPVKKPLASSLQAQILVKQSLAAAVKRAIQEQKLLRSFALNNDAPGDATYTITLKFHVYVDRKRQMQNRDGASIMGPVGWIFGAIMPWACHVTYTLQGLIMQTDAKELARHEFKEEENKIGAMTWCPSVDDPNDAIIKKLVASFFGKLASDNVLQPAE